MRKTSTAMTEGGGLSGGMDDHMNSLEHQALEGMDGIQVRQAIAKKESLTKAKKSVSDVRGHWNNKTEFLLSCIGLSVGLGNLWKFPFLAYKHGGAAFILVYLILQLLIGLPVYLMELAMGQYSGQGPSLVFRSTPIAKGVGVSMTLASASLCLFYAAILALCLFYMFASMQGELPWVKCKPEWLKYNCWVHEGQEGYTMPTCPYNHTGETNVTRYTGLCKCAGFRETDFHLEACRDIDGIDLLSYGELLKLAKDKTLNCTLLGCTNVTKSPGHFYLYDEVMERTNSTLSDIGTPLWDMSLCLLVVWIITVLAAMKGIKASGKVVYFTALFPYVMTSVLIIKTATLPGSAVGVNHFILPDWQKFLDKQVWIDAGAQVFFSLSISSGPIITLGSYNVVHNDCLIDAIVVTFADLGTSLFAGINVFMMLGAMAHERNVPFNEVTQPNYGLVFVTYPEALARFPVPQLWSVLFFLMLFTLGIDSQFEYMESVVRNITDAFPKLLKYKMKITIAGGVLGYLFGLTLVSPAGSYIIDILDSYGFTYPLYFICLGELFATMWMYDVIQLMKDMHYMLGYRLRPAIYWIGCWNVIAPLIIIGLALVNLFAHAPLSYTMNLGTNEYPVRHEGWVEAVSWLVTCAVVIPMPIMAVWVMYHAEGDTLMKKFVNSIKPDPLWQAQDKGTQEDHVTYITS